MKTLYFERNEQLVRYAKETLKRIFLYSGAENVNKININRCLNELGKFVDLCEEKTSLAIIKKRETQMMESIKKREVNISPTIVIEPKNVIQKSKPINLFFQEYKEAYGLEDKDFGFHSYRPRSKEFVFNRAMFSRFAYGCGYTQSEISRFLRINRSSVIHYLHDYKNKMENV